MAALIRGRGPNQMSAHAIAKARRREGPVLTWPFVVLVLAVAAAAAFVSDVLWPSWPSEPVALDGPALPITVTGTLFSIPPAAIRETVQRHPGQHERVDLVFSWPALTPAAKNRARDKAPVTPESALAAVSQAENNRLFVTIAALAGVLPPLERLRTIYPRYLAGQSESGPDGLALLSFLAPLMKGRTSSTASIIPSSFSHAARARPARLRVAVSANAHLAARRSVSAFRAIVLRIGEMSPQPSTA